MLLDSTGIQLYQAITGSLVLLGQCTRYDITYTVNSLTRAMSKPSKLHMTEAKHLLRSLMGDMGLAITYKTGCFEMTGYCDASWGNNPDNAQGLAIEVLLCFVFFAIKFRQGFVRRFCCVYVFVFLKNQRRVSYRGFVVLAFRL